ncbi:uncharacterized protein IL334_006885 [Kwoniella shivajii]|uniref:Myosin heavy chain n=1 Tax=Kwoniella shivajii TaxID=564305 RepID=A0ABZ1D778_9TREE|nr:hypothetical protein IL334_006885 [Kwoniella shivajii]
MAERPESQNSEAFSLKTMNDPTEKNAKQEEVEQLSQGNGQGGGELIQETTVVRPELDQVDGGKSSPGLTAIVHQDNTGPQEELIEDVQAQKAVKDTDNENGDQSDVDHKADGLEHAEVQKKEENKIVQGVKDAAGGVKNVLKSGVFGAGSPKSTPKSTLTTSTSRPTTTVRQSLAPTRTSLKPTTSSTRPAVSTTMTGTTTSRPRHTSTLSQSTSSARPTGGVTRPTAATSTKTEPTRPGAPTTSSTMSNAPARAATKPILPTTGTSSNGIKAQPRPSIKPPIPAAGTARATKPLATSGISNGTVRKPESRPPANVPSKNSASSSTPKPRVGLASSTSRLSTKPPVGRPSMLPPSRPSVGAAQKSRGGSEPSATTGTGGSHEVAGLKDKILELEKRSDEEKDTFEKRIAELDREKTGLEENHANAIEDLRSKVEQASAAGVDNDNKIAELRENHVAELKLAEEQKDVAVKELEERLIALSTEKQSLISQLDSLQAELSGAQSSIAKLNTALNTVQNEVSTLRAAQDESTSALDQLKEAKSSLEVKVTELEKMKEKLEGDLAEGADQAEKSVVGVNGLEDQIRDLQEEIDELQKELEKAKESSKGDDARWAQEKEDLIKNIETHKSASKDHKDALDKITTESRTRHDELQDLQITHEQLTTTHAALLESSAQHSEALAQLELRLKEANEKHDALLAESSSISQHELEDKLTDVTRAKDTAETELVDVKTRSGELEEEVEQLAEVRRIMEAKEASLNEIIAKLEGEKEKEKEESEQKYSKAVEDAKVAASEAHHGALAAIKEELASTRSSLHEAHSAEIEALKSSHSIAILDVQADHLKSTQSLEETLLSAQAQVVASKDQLGELTETNENLKSELSRLIDEVEHLGKGDPEMEVELKKIKGELQGVKDELAGAKEMAEMNKSHFESSIAAIQDQHSENERESTERRVRDTYEAEERYKREADEMKRLMKDLEEKLQDERLEKNNALAKLAAIRTPPNSPPPTQAHSPALTKLHEAHNAKVVDLENEIKRLQHELVESRKGSVIEDDIDETETF